MGVLALSLGKMMRILNNLCYHILKTLVIVLVQFAGVLANPQFYHMLSNFSSRTKKSFPIFTNFRISTAKTSELIKIVLHRFNVFYAIINY